MVQMLFSQIQQAPGPDFRKVGKSLLIDWISNITTVTYFPSLSLSALYSIWKSVSSFTKPWANIPSTRLSSRVFKTGKLKYKKNQYHVKYREQKFHWSASNYEWNLKRMINFFQCTCPVGWVLRKDILEEVILHITPLFSLLHTLLNDKCKCLQDEWKS